ncbi:hypothetical protein [Helicobacter sp. T3_23-1056]
MWIATLTMEGGIHAKTPTQKQTHKKSNPITNPIDCHARVARSQ